MLKKNKTVFIIIIGIISLILLHNPLLNLTANIMTAFRKNNLDFLQLEAYKNKIEYLEKEILEYQTTHKNIPIYKGSSLVLSKIALRSIYNFYDSIIIISDYKVTKASPVVNESGLVGFIEETDGTSSKVELITSNSKLSVKVCNSYGLLNKYLKKEKLLVLSNINNYEDITEECTTETSGLQGITPGLKIGKVEKVETKGIERIVYVKPFVDFDNLNYLYVMEQ